MRASEEFMSNKSRKKVALQQGCWDLGVPVLVRVLETITKAKDQHKNAFFGSDDHNPKEATI